MFNNRLTLYKNLICSSLIMLACCIPAQANEHNQTINVVVSIKPIHSIVSSIMQNTDNKPSLLVTGARSPHNYRFKPSDMRRLEQADVIFWIGQHLEGFLTKPLANLQQTKVVAFSKLTTLTLHPNRAHDQHHDHHHDHHHNHQTEEFDPHIWLDPENAIAIAEHVTEVLTQQDPQHADRYRQNAIQTIANLKQLDAELAEQLQTLNNKAYLVFHDAYQYFEKRYALKSVAALTTNPEHKPSAKHLLALLEQVKDTRARCIFHEPQFNARTAKVLAEATNVKTGLLDPHGAQIDAGPRLYQQLMTDLAMHLIDCLN